MQSLAVSLVGSPLSEFSRRMPSFLRGSLIQSLACYDAPASLPTADGPPVLLVPGIFCTPSVMNRLGAALASRGAQVHLTPRAYPFLGGIMANTCSLERAADLLLEDLAAMKREQGVERLTLVGHSNGALISLLALERAPDHGADLPEIAGVVSMATPFGGAPIAAHLAWALPACADIRPGADMLDRIARQADHVRLSLVSAFDLLVPDPSAQVLGDAPTVVMEGFQHMDFTVGSDEKVRDTARIITEHLEATPC
jgi:pimeloyl-ACP methyl ester carboxylesterase